MPIAANRRMITGGSFGSPKMDLKGCVLYAPLWRQEGASSPFNSSGVYGTPIHTCTVTGATWTPQGRSFPGNAIIVTDTIAVGTGKFTMSCVVKVAALPGTFYCLLGGAVNYSGLLMEPTGFNVGKLGAAPGSVVAYTIPLNTFLRVTAVVTSTTTADIYVNGTSIGTSTCAQAWTQANRIFNLGAAIGVADIPLTGTLGEVEAWNKALTAAEDMHNYQATKWRYN